MLTLQQDQIATLNDILKHVNSKYIYAVDDENIRRTDTQTKLTATVFRGTQRDVSAWLDGAIHAVMMMN